MGVLPGREDWDFVTFANYTADMKEITDTAASAIERMRRRAEIAERALTQVVLQAGGMVRIPDDFLYKPETRNLISVERAAEDRTIIIRAHEL